MVQPLAQLGDALVVFADLDADRPLTNARQHLAGFDDGRAGAIRHGVAPQQAVFANLEVESAQPGVGQYGGVGLRMPRNAPTVQPYLDDIPTLPGFLDGIQAWVTSGAPRD